MASLLAVARATDDARRALLPLHAFIASHNTLTPPTGATGASGCVISLLVAFESWCMQRLSPTEGRKEAITTTSLVAVAILKHFHTTCVAVFRQGVHSYATWREWMQIVARPRRVGVPEQVAASPAVNQLLLTMEAEALTCFRCCTVHALTARHVLHSLQSLRQQANDEDDVGTVTEGQKVVTAARTAEEWIEAIHQIRGTVARLHPHVVGVTFSEERSVLEQHVLTREDVNEEAYEAQVRATYKEQLQRTLLSSADEFQTVKSSYEDFELDEAKRIKGIPPTQEKLMYPGAAAYLTWLREHAPALEQCTDTTHHNNGSDPVDDATSTASWEPAARTSLRCLERVTESMFRGRQYAAALAAEINAMCSPAVMQLGVSFEYCARVTKIAALVEHDGWFTAEQRWGLHHQLALLLLIGSRRSSAEQPRSSSSSTSNSADAYLVNGLCYLRRSATLSVAGDDRLAAEGGVAGLLSAWQAGITAPLLQQLKAAASQEATAAVLPSDACHLAHCALMLEHAQISCVIDSAEVAMSHAEATLGTMLDVLRRVLQQDSEGEVSATNTTNNISVSSSSTVRLELGCLLVTAAHHLKQCGAATSSCVTVYSTVCERVMTQLRTISTMTATSAGTVMYVVEVLCGQDAAMRCLQARRTLSSQLVPAEQSTETTLSTQPDDAARPSLKRPRVEDGDKPIS